jgi:hypothetical protein
MTKTIYLIDPETRVLLGSSPHPLDPVETARAGEPVYAQLNEALATDIEPPRVTEGMRAVLVDQAWVLEEVARPPVEAVTAEPPAGPESTEPTLEDKANAFKALIQEYMDAMARSLNYDDIKTAVTYAEEPSVPKFQNEGRALRAWRSQVWAASYALLAWVEAGEVDVPSERELIDSLPRLVVPPLEPPATVQGAGGEEIA